MNDEADKTRGDLGTLWAISKTGCEIDWFLAFIVRHSLPTPGPRDSWFENPGNLITSYTQAIIKVELFGFDRPSNLVTRPPSQ